MIIKNGLVALPGKDDFSKLDIKIENGKIIKIAENIADKNEVIDASGLFVFPGGIDPHVHFNDPGYTFNEDFYHGSCAAASGGITTVIDMPCTSIPPITNKQNLEKKLAVVQKKSIMDFGLFGGISAQSFTKGFPENVYEISKYVLGYKTYFISGMETFGRLEKYQFKQVLQKVKDLDLPVLVHAEDYDYIESATEFYKKQDSSMKNYYLSRPETAEILAVKTATEVARETGCELHIVHVSCAEAAKFLVENKISFETAPHYLEFDILDFERIGSALKTTPPVKSPENKVKLWQLLAEGKINFVASDHAPSPKKKKNTGSIWTDYSGIPGTGTLIPYLFSEGFLKGRLSLQRFLDVTSKNTAKKYRVSHKKGSIEIGKDADFVLIDPNKNWIVEGEKFLSKGKITPFESYKFKGKIIKTILRGKVIYDSELGITADAGFGNFITKE
ncbi:MAG: dihydroorotase [Armatimonadetes bacterium]|nr:dihydroorotase [Armatimonadota bacterium]